MAGAILGAAGSILGGITGGKGASAAAKAQAQAQQQALALQQQEFNTNQQNFAPYIAAGNSALGSQQTLLGLNGNAAQQGAIDGIKAGPEYTSLYGTGLDAILQNAAATGGLRGGNTALAQSNFGSSLLGTIIQNQLSNLGGISSLGAGAAGAAAGAGQNNANAQSGIYGALGASNAGAAAAPYNAFTSILNGTQNSGILNAFGGMNRSSSGYSGGSLLPSGVNAVINGGAALPTGSGFNFPSGAW